MPERLTRNKRARAAGVPKWLRRYCTRYSKAGLDGLIACHLQNPAPMLDHGRDRAARKGHGWITGTADIDAINAAAERDDQA